MRRSNKPVFLLLLAAFLTVSVSGCGKKETACPFTSIVWGNTLEDVIKLEGDDGETYDSIYDGVTYAFPKEYEGLQGTIKYMFNDKNQLVSMSWMYETDDAEDLNAVYEQIHGKAENMLGKSGFTYNREELEKVASPGDVWYLESGNVVLTTVNASDLKALQYTFLHPDVSEERPQKTNH